MDFWKLQGTGNDFVLVDDRAGEARDWAEIARAMCDRHYGVGADGLLLVQRSAIADYRMVMHNPDGSVAEMCGNGLRCFARRLFDGVERGRQRLEVETGAGVLTVSRVGAQSFRLAMGTPSFDGPGHGQPFALSAGGLPATYVSMGNPHVVHFVDAVDQVDLATLGPRVERSPEFPQRVNLHIAQVVDRSHLWMRTWERGAGLTLACGTGACATAVAAMLRGHVDPEVHVRVPGGELDLAWDGATEVYLTGPAEPVFRGSWLPA